MNLNTSEHIGDVLTATVLTAVIGLLATSVIWVSFHFASNKPPTSVTTYVVMVAE